jgi:hypothetical protein
MDAEIEAFLTGEVEVAAVGNWMVPGSELVCSLGHVSISISSRSLTAYGYFGLQIS